MRVRVQKISLGWADTSPEFSQEQINLAGAVLTETISGDKADATNRGSYCRKWISLDWNRHNKYRLECLRVFDWCLWLLHFLYKFGLILVIFQSRWLPVNNKQVYDAGSVYTILLLPIQTSPKQPWPSLSSSRRDSRGISQASLARPWVWGLTVGQTVVSLWHSPSACSAIKPDTEIKTLRCTQRCHTHPQISEPARYSVLKAGPFSWIDSFHLMLMNLDALMITVMKYKWD